MSPYDQKTIFTALAFLAILLKDGSKAKKDRAAQVNQLAELFEKFCAENVSAAPSFPSVSLEEEPGAAALDADIERYVRELRQNEQTHLPEDGAALLKLYDRLQLRKSRRMQREFYASTSAEKLADVVIRYLDEEIEAAGGLL